MPPKRPATSTAGAAPKKSKSAAAAPAASKSKALDPEIAQEMANTPLAKLYQAMKVMEANKAKDTTGSTEGKGVVVYWMRNKDLRLTDNRALAEASATAISLSVPLVVLHIFSPSDYASHHRSARRINFQLRALSLLKADLDKLNIPLYSVIWEDRKLIEERLEKLLLEWGARSLWANLEYEVDELRRDRKIVENVTGARRGEREGWTGGVRLLKDFTVVPPNEVLTLQGKPYAVFSPWYKNWSATIAKNPSEYIGDAGSISPNSPEARDHPVLKGLWATEIPASIKGYELTDKDQKKMNELWPVGDKACNEVLQNFLTRKSREKHFQFSPIHPGAQEATPKESKAGQYGTGRNRVDIDGSSHLSAYLATGMLSPRQCLRASMKLTGGRLQTDKDDGGVGVWVSEIAWRDFYQHVLAAWPRVCMGRPFNLKFDNIVWEESEEKLQAWKDGRTGFPIVDAAMRALKEQGWMHNRCRMIVAMFLTKDLLLDWRLGEQYFNEQLIDQDFASNNGGWQWSASVGTDPQPYFRVFNPTSQSEKSDLTGDYIRHWVPELSKLKGKVLHDPGSKFGKKELEKMGYCKPIVDHAPARIRAIARYKNPGSADNE